MEEEKKIVKYDNKFNIANLNDMTKIEQDIFITICSKFTKEKVDKLELSYAEIKKDANLSLRKYTNKNFKEFMLSTQAKILKINFSVDDGTGIRQRPLFREFYTPHDKDCTLIQLDDLFLEYLYNIPQKIAFSQFELDNFLALNSKYSKTLLRFLLQNFSGKWSINWNDFKTKLGFPLSQKSTQCTRTLDKAIAELEKTGLVKDIKYVVEKGSGRGSPIQKINFTFTINKKKKMELEGQSTITDYIEQPPVTDETIFDKPHIKATTQEVIRDVVSKSHFDSHQTQKEENSPLATMYDDPVVITPLTNPVITSTSDLAPHKVWREGDECPHCHRGKFVKRINKATHAEFLSCEKCRCYPPKE